jgi:hypothetical protein
MKRDFALRFPFSSSVFVMQFYIQLFASRRYSRRFIIAIVMQSGIRMVRFGSFISISHKKIVQPDTRKKRLFS